MATASNPFSIEARALASAAGVTRNDMALWTKADCIVVPPVDASLGRGRRYGVVNAYELALLRRLMKHTTLKAASEIVRHQLTLMLAKAAQALCLEPVPGFEGFHDEAVLEESDFYKAAGAAVKDRIYWVIPNDGDYENAIHSIDAGWTLGAISEKLAMVDGFCVLDLSDVVVDVNEKLFGSLNVPGSTGGYAD